jgi:hypothetical protein
MVLEIPRDLKLQAGLEEYVQPPLEEEVFG